VVSDDALPFSIEHGPIDLETTLTDDSVLGIFCYGKPGTRASDPRVLHVPLEILDGAGLMDVLHSSQPVTRGLRGDFAYAHNDSVLLGQLTLRLADASDVESQAFAAYQKIRDALDRLGFPHPLRLWNYIDNINQGEGDAEVYKQFCLGRARTVDATPENEKILPAASAIGSHGNNGNLVIHVLAAQSPGVQVENPRQVSAFHYPRQYGIRSPSFSRARLMYWPGVAHLYLSGTASVVGHETLHAGDCRAQTLESLRNVDTILEAATTTAEGDARFSHQHLKLLRVYIRNPQDLALVKTCIEAHIGQSAPVIYLQGSICRQDLLVEIDGLYLQSA
jgi:chorismate lyase / 3-hydroxybenzoate synthase